jgi:hypothetical protein
MKGYNFNTHNLKLSCKLIVRHSWDIRVLSQSYVTSEEILKCQNHIQNIQKEGLTIYSVKGDSTHDKEWITINSHYMTQTQLNTERFGVPRSTAVFAFESELGFMKTWDSQHKNGISEGGSMLWYLKIKHQHFVYFN